MNLNRLIKAVRNSVNKGIHLVVIGITCIAFMLPAVSSVSNASEIKSIDINVETLESTETSSSDDSSESSDVTAEAIGVTEGTEYDANSNPYGTPIKIRRTFYTDDEQPTYSGQPVRSGIVAGKKEWVGKTVILYRCDKETGAIGEVIGIYEVLDTGAGIGGTSLKTGDSIDVWFPSEKSGWDHIHKYGDYVYMQLVDSLG